ncbi:fumarylacetoacetate hydrolase family protein [Micromonospora echinospora]|uniref:fumarylacetoacetate hydrolase family protein n=1 Tax=Micromonospora echinospora TaxID=1877 RepID=UPI003799531F
MRLTTFSVPDDPAPHWGFLDGSPDDGGIVDVTRLDGPYPSSVADLVGLDPSVRDAVLDRLRGEARATATRKLADVTLLAPIAPRRNVFAVGANYRSHVAESAHSVDEPDRPIFFTKATTTVTGPGPVPVDPSLTSRVDWEVELAVVLGTGGRDLGRDAVFGYLVANDLSARDQQHDRPEGQWFLGKSLDGFCPLGPWLVTADEVADPQALTLRLSVNGTVKQEADTAGMIFPVGELITELSRFVTLHPGDILLTGTPAGVGDARNPPEYLWPGDEVVAEVDGLGRLVNQIVEVRP